MSTLPAASSFSGSEGSAGVCGCTSRPDRAEVAVGDRRVQRRVVGVGEEVEHHRERLGARRRDRVLLGAAGAERERDASASSDERGAAAGGAARGVGRRSQGVSPRGRLRPRRERALGERERVEAGDREGEQHERAPAYARGRLQAVRSAMISWPSPA